MHEVEETAVPAPGLLKPGVLLVSAVGLVAIHSMLPSGIADLTNPRSLAAILSGNPLGTPAGFTILSIILILVGVPRLLLFAAGGLLMGVGEGFMMALFASVAGSYANFRFLRWGGKDWMAKRAKGKLLGKITASEPTIISVFLIRQLPVSNLLINAGLAMGRVKSPAFVIGSLLGFMPQGIVASLIGGGLSADEAARSACQLGIAGAILAGTWFLWNAWQRNQRSMEESN